MEVNVRVLISEEEVKKKRKREILLKMNMHIFIGMVK